MFIAENCFRCNQVPMRLKPEIIGSALLQSLAADLVAAGIVGPFADLSVLVFRVSRPFPAAAGTGGDDVA